MGKTSAPRIDGSAHSPLVVSVVVHYGGPADTIACVESLLAVDYPNHSVVVVDNGPGEGGADVLRAALPGEVRLLGSGRNLGYGAGANLGLRWALEAGAEYAWVLNNDTTVDGQSVTALVRAMESDPICGAASPQIEAAIGPESPTGIWYAGGSADVSRARTSHVRALLESNELLVPTGFVTGCAMFLRVAALADTGLFWEKLFLYWEDVELSLRLRGAGWHLGVAPAARIWHAVHGAVASADAGYHFNRSAILVALRVEGRRGATRTFLQLYARAGRRWLMCLVRGRRPWPTAEIRGLFAGVRAALKDDGKTIHAVPTDRT